MGITDKSYGAPQDITRAISQAAQKTGVNFDYLMTQARTESGFKSDAKASTSSATGLYQFIDQTWLATVSKFGSKHGLGDMANAIQKDFQGRYFVADDTIKQNIMTLRKDPQVASLMAAEFAADNQNYLEQKIDRNINATDLYMAHFLGAGGASKFLSSMENDPNQPAAALLPSAAKANKNIFYNSNGSTKTLQQVYNGFSTKFDDVTPVQLSTNEPTQLAYQPYTRDLSFERMYGNKVDQFIAALPSLPAIQSDGFFANLMRDPANRLGHNQLTDPSLFLTLTMLDTPK